MSIFMVYDHRGEVCGAKRSPHEAIAQAREQAMETGQWADIVKIGTNSRRRVYASGKIFSMPKGG